MATIHKVGVKDGDSKTGIYEVRGTVDDDVLKKALTTNQVANMPSYSAYFQKMSSRLLRLSEKKALDQMSGGSGALSKLGSQIDTDSPQMHSPLFNYLNFYIPSSRQNINAYVRYYHLFHPVIRNGISLLTELIMPDFDFTADDTNIANFFNDIKEEMGMYRAYRTITEEYKMFGDSVDYWHWDEDAGYYTDIDTSTINEMWHVIKIPMVVGDNATQFFYDQYGVDTFRKTLELLPSTIQEEIKNEMNPDIYEASEERKMLRVEPFNLTMTTNRGEGERGISQVQSVLKELLYEDILRFAQWKIAEKRAGATRLWRLGSDTFPATEEWIEDFAGAMESLEEGIVPEIFMPHNIDVQDIGIAGKTLNIIQELQFVEDRLLTGLGINKAMTRAEGPAYAPSAIAYSILRARIMSERENILEPVNAKMAVVSIVNDYYELTTAEKKHGIRKDGKKRKYLRKAIRELHTADWYDEQEHQIKITEYKTALVKYSQDNKTTKRADSQYGNYIVPDVVFDDRIKLEADKERFDRARALFDKGLFPFKDLLEMGGWESDEIISGLENQVGSIADPVVRQAMNQALTKLYQQYYENGGEKPKADLGFGDQPASATPGAGGGEGGATGLRPEKTPLGETPTGEAPITEVPEPTE